MNRYIFYIRTDIVNLFEAPVLSLDMFYKMKTPKMDMTAFKVAQQFDPSFGAADANVMNAMSLRAQFDEKAVGPYLVEMEDAELDRDVFEGYLNTLLPDKEIRNVLTRGKDMNEHFSMTTEGFLQAKEWLEEIGEWQHIGVNGFFSVDGFSVVCEANYLWETKPQKRIIIEKNEDDNTTKT